jgi:hypothetical protein
MRRLRTKAKRAEQQRVIAEQEEIFCILDALRESEEINMFGAAPYLRGIVGEENMTRREAREWLKRWMTQPPQTAQDTASQPRRKLRVQQTANATE